MSTRKLSGSINSIINSFLDKKALRMRDLHSSHVIPNSRAMFIIRNAITKRSGFIRCIAVGWVKPATVHPLTDHEGTFASNLSMGHYYFVYFWRSPTCHLIFRHSPENMTG